MDAFWHGFKTAALRKEVELQPHQTRALGKLKKNNALLLYHGLGSGKTLTSIAGTENEGGADVVVPAALRGNYAKEIKKFTKRPAKRHVMSYEAAAKDGLPGGEALVIDEAQRLGTSATTRSQALRDAAPKYKKRILLSGTPVRNAPHELAPLIRILNPASRIPLDQKEFDRQYIQDVKISPGIIGRLRGLKPGIEQRAKNLGTLAGEVRGRVDYHMPTKEHYPDRHEETRVIPMDDEQSKIYKAVTQQANPIIAAKVRSNLPLSKRELTNLNAFMTAARMVSNTTAPYGGKGTSNKVKTMVTDIVEGHNADPNFKSVTYSNYLEGGVHQLAKHLEEKKIPFAIFSGELSDKKRKQAVDDYNSGKIKALLISGAGAEGLDLKGTKLFQVMEPHWNQARTEQAKGRAIRYMSHAHLPKNERKVRVVNYHSTLPNTLMRRIFRKEAPTTADQYLHTLGGKKQALIDQFLNVLKEEGEKTAFWNGFLSGGGL